jgi:hypothetical protein
MFYNQNVVENIVSRGGFLLVNGDLSKQIVLVESRLECARFLNDPKLCHVINPKINQNW